MYNQKQQNQTSDSNHVQSNEESQASSIVQKYAADEDVSQVNKAKSNEEMFKMMATVDDELTWNGTWSRSLDNVIKMWSSPLQGSIIDSRLVKFDSQMSAEVTLMCFDCLPDGNIINKEIEPATSNRIKGNHEIFER